MGISKYFPEEYLVLVITLLFGLDAALGKVNRVGIALTDDQLEKLCKFNSIADGYNVCQNVNSSDGTPNVLVTSTLDLMCDAVREALDFKCSRCMTLESPVGSNRMVPVCALTADCHSSLDDEAAWMYLTTQSLSVDVPTSQQCATNGFKTVHEECSGKTA
ncbi:uncharacterized protein LOC103514592 [Diaphorina citri]|uniref:Uncharacterized protein LOC103514592 n=1 Tax=Diaphorina citri TaxID=121845 RepID=A0A1S3DA85_DIACI|nr:uncharacterized protein LOC103514592 [Diaphorina citri]